MVMAKLVKETELAMLVMLVTLVMLVDPEAVVAAAEEPVWEEVPAVLAAEADEETEPEAEPEAEAEADDAEADPSPW